MKYPEIERLGLRYFQVNESFCFYVEADNLERLLSEAPTVFCSSIGNGPWEICPTADEATHTAKLISVQPIKREPCKHQIIEYTSKIFGLAKCGICKANLRAEWKEVGGE